MRVHGHLSAYLSLDEAIPARKLLVLLLVDADPGSKRNTLYGQGKHLFTFALCNRKQFPVGAYDSHNATLRF